MLVHSRPFFFFFNDTATTEIYTLSLHDALPIYRAPAPPRRARPARPRRGWHRRASGPAPHSSAATSTRATPHGVTRRSEEHTSELQSQSNLVCRLLLEKKKKKTHRDGDAH